MTKALMAFLLTLIFILLPTTAISQTIEPVTTEPVIEIPPVEPTAREKMQTADFEKRLQIVTEIVKRKALQYGVSETQMLVTLKCENRDLVTTLQSGHRYRFEDLRRGIRIGEQERSFGLSQIHLPDHPSVSYEQATDPEYAIDFMAEHFSRGQQRQWSCWKMHYQ